MKQRQVAVPVVDLLDAPEGRRARQVVMGQHVEILENGDGWCHVRALADGYVGYLCSSTLGKAEEVTHRVTARSTHLYPEADFKTRETAALSHGSRLAVLREEGRFFETRKGFVPKAHVAPLDPPERDPVAVAARFEGTPYLWGGNSGFGIDCSGLVQAACLACGIDCPGDSGMQAEALGREIGPGEALRRNDLLFWKGHVAWVVDEATLLHANVFHMAVAVEGLGEAITRIEAQGDGAVTARKRLEIFE
ncbi:MAG: Cell wall-associated hydrolases (invasion-associated proteins) [Rhodobacteraceae bacterium HLUCCO07]|nr:MAG: Cell wall-associated hydrolases (invasion-associated proteins) [Rhodobacteraceae bacterium HLUCCO07]